MTLGVTNYAAMTLADRIRLLMELRDVKQNELARRVKLTSGAMSLLLSGDSKKPSQVTLLRLADVLEAHPEWILHGTGPMLRGEGPPAELSEAVDLLKRLDADELETVVKLLRSMRRGDE